MSELAIEIDRVSRMFKRYRHPRYQVLDALGLDFSPKNYDEFWALRDVSMQMRRGERVGIIGRNGAGKSTLLSIVCGRLQASSGRVSVNGRIQALMELGTGFHPEFSGRQNVLASLAYQGITGRRAMALLDDIFDFAELEEFIDQPVKTYSTGMYARLAFTTATSLEPDILIIDEVLGAGDAYFAAKSTDRMRRLTIEAGSTVLFVSHDVSAVQLLCERAIWIDRGRIRMEGPTLDVSKSYYASVLEQEEARLRARTTRAVSRRQGEAATAAADADSDLHILRFAIEGGAAPQLHHPIRRIALLPTDSRLVEVWVGDAMDNDESQAAYLLTDPQETMWSRPIEIGGVTARQFEDTGGKYQHAPVMVRLPPGALGQRLRVRVEHAAKPGETIVLDLHTGTDYLRVGTLEPSETGWREQEFVLGPAESVAAPADHVVEPIEQADVAPINSVAAVTATDELSLPDETLSPNETLDEAQASLEIASAAEQTSTILASEPDEAPPPSTGMHEPAPAPAPPAPTHDKWETREARFIDIVPCDVEGLGRKHIFALGEDIAFRVVAQIRTNLPPFWLVAVMYDQLGTRIALIVEQVTDGAEIGTHEFTLTLRRPNLRQGEYVLTFELLPEFHLDWTGEGRLPYLCHWDRCVFIRVDENYLGAMNLGCVELPSAMTRRRVDADVANPIAALQS